jgi:hypothetical protein
MLYHATADSLAYIGEDSSLDLFFDEFLSVTDPIKIKILNQSVKKLAKFQIFIPGHFLSLFVLSKPL